MPCVGCAPRHAVFHLGQDGRRLAKSQRDGRDRQPRQANADKTASEPERQHLHQVHGDNLRRCVAPTHFSTAMLRIFCMHKDARHARHGDAAENDDDEADQAEVVLCAVEVAAHFIVVSRETSARSRTRSLKSLVQRLDERLDALLGNPDQQHASGPAAEPQQPRRGEIVEVDEDARAETELADPPAGLGLDHAADLERRLRRSRARSPTVQPERRQQFGPNQRAVVLEQRMRIGLAVDRAPACRTAETPVERPAVPPSASSTRDCVRPDAPSSAFRRFRSVRWRQPRRDAGR